MQNRIQCKTLEESRAANEESVSIYIIKLFVIVSNYCYCFEFNANDQASPLNVCAPKFHNIFIS